MMAKRRPMKPVQTNIVNMAQEQYVTQVLGSLAMEPERITPPAAKPRPQQRPQLRVLPRRRKAVAMRPQFSFVAKLVMTLAVVLLLSTGVLLVDKLAAIADNNSMIAAKQQELEDITRKAEQLEVRLAMSSDLNHVITVASQELGMSAPQEQMCHEIALEDTAQQDSVTAEQTEDGFDLLAMIGKITELLH